jgi:acetoin utilization deacetylase AcuC-like enzyme
VFLQEGGYNPHYVPFCIHEIVATMAGAESLVDPLLPVWTQYETDAYEQRHRMVVDEAVSRITDIPL